jgi:hypothetical protein
MTDDGGRLPSLKDRAEQVPRPHNGRGAAKAHVTERVNPGAAFTKLGQQPPLRGDRELEAISAALRERREHSLDPAVEAAARDVEYSHGFSG